MDHRDSTTNSKETTHHRRRGVAPSAPATSEEVGSSKSKSNTSRMDYTMPVEKDGILAVSPGAAGSSLDHHAHPPDLAESHTRSLLKGLTWRILATTATTIIAWLVTGHVEAALQIGFWEFFAKLGIYYVHERIWIKVRI
jgi:uncharacterized membrane protein